MIDTEAPLPGFWMYETCGALRPAIEAYLSGKPMSTKHVVTMRAYLRQWIMAPAWHGPEIAELRETIDDLTSRRAIDDWLTRALDEGIDPL
jgi:hypothetical protein